LSQPNLVAHGSVEGQDKNINYGL